MSTNFQNNPHYCQSNRPWQQSRNW